MSARSRLSFAHRLVPTVLALALVGCGLPGPGAGVAREGAGAAAAGRELISTVTGDAPNFAQCSDGTLMTVVSREWGRGAKAGALVELFYPRYATDHLWDSYVGLQLGGKTQWAHGMKLIKQTIIPDTGRIVSQFATATVGLEIEDLVAPQGHVHMRRVTITNRSGRVLDQAGLVFYGFFTIDHLPGGDRARIEQGAWLQSEGKTALAVVPERAPDAWHLGYANAPIGAREDAREAAENGRFNQTGSIGPVPSGINGTMRHALAPIAPGASASMTYAIGVAETEPAALAAARGWRDRGFAAASAADAERYGALLSRYKQPQGLPVQAQAVYRRALIALDQVTADNGAVVAAPTNLNPPYRFVWPRDGAFITLARLEAGDAEPAKRFFTFNERLQQPSGGWAVNFFPDGSKPLWDFGRNGNEHDQVGMHPWGVYQTYRATGDGAWLAARWPAVKRACEFLLGVQRPDGLLSACRDLWELDTDGSWTYSNGAGWAGLVAGATIAKQQGDLAAAARYEAAAAKLKAAVKAQLAPEGYLVRGLRPKGPDRTLEAANLALGGPFFAMFADDEPIMAATGDRVAGMLSSAGGGVRRYEGDRYYDGQPWPVATAWLALHQQARGDAAGARTRFATMTRYAGATESLQLGEQLDETTQRWVSAFPLAWSEAAYVVAGLRLYGR